MKENTVEGIQDLRLLDNVLQYSNNAQWKPVIQSVVNKTEGFTLELFQIGKYFRINSSSTENVTIPKLNFPIGSSVVFEQTGTGTITLVEGTGVTLNGELSTIDQYNIIQIIKVDINTWTVIGGTTAV